MKYYQVTITGIIPIEDGDPSPEHWPWTPKEKMLAQIDEHLLGIDIRFDPLCPRHSQPIASKLGYLL